MEVAKRQSLGQTSQSSVEFKADVGEGSSQACLEKKVKSTNFTEDRKSLQTFEALVGDTWHLVEVAGENVETGELLVRPCGCHAVLQDLGLQLAKFEPTHVHRNHLRHQSKAFSRSAQPLKNGTGVLAVAQCGGGNPCVLVDGEVVGKRQRVSEIDKGMASFWAWDYQILFDHGHVVGQEQWVPPQHVLGTRMRPKSRCNTTYL
jgi:hypothetical protein